MQALAPARAFVALGRDALAQGNLVTAERELAAAMDIATRAFERRTLVAELVAAAASRIEGPRGTIGSHRLCARAFRARRSALVRSKPRESTAIFAS